MNRLLRLTAILLFAAASTIYAATPSGIRCSAPQDPRASFGVDREPNWHFLPIDAASFRATFGAAKKTSFGHYTFVIATKDSETPGEQSTSLMIGVSVDDRTFFRVVDAEGDWPKFDPTDEALVDDLDGPATVRLENTAEGNLFLITVRSRYRAHVTTEFERTYVVSVKPQLKIVASVDCEETGGGGACGAFDLIFSPHDALQCDWSQPLRDFACTNTRAYADIHWMTHPAERRFTLLGGQPLPVTKERAQSFHTLQELGQRAWTDFTKPTQRVMVDGIGLLALLGFGSLRVPVYVAPGMDDDMELRLFALPREGPPVAVPLRKIVDGHEDREQTKPPDDNGYTPVGEEWSVAPGDSFALGRVAVFPIVLHDGKGRGVFWLGIDRSTKPPVMSLLRIAADVGPYGQCRTFVYPASVSAVTIAGEHADLIIEPHSRRGEEGAVDERYSEDDAKLPCHVRGTVTWDHEKGFSLSLSDVPCQPSETRVGLVIDSVGHLSTAPLRYEKDQ